MASNRLAHMAAMQQHNSILATLGLHIDIKASIFLSFVGVMLFAYGYGPVSNLVVFALGMVFASAFPIRIGAMMLADRPIKLGGGDISIPMLFSMTDSDDLAIQKKMAKAHKKAIRHNSKTLKEKHRQNRNLIATSLLLFGYLMAMTIVIMAMTPAGI